MSSSNSWSDLVWRLALTVFLLLMLAGPGLTQFTMITTAPTAQALPVAIK